MHARCPLHRSAVWPSDEEVAAALVKGRVVVVPGSMFWVSSVQLSSAQDSLMLCAACSPELCAHSVRLHQSALLCQLRPSQGKMLSAWPACTELQCTNQAHHALRRTCCSLPCRPTCRPSR
jgi:hypothetical protein